MSNPARTLQLAALIMASAAISQGAIIYQNFNQTITSGNPFSFGFDGTSFTSGTGGYIVTYNAAQYYPEQTYYWTDADGTPQSYTYPAMTFAAYMTVDTPGYPQYITKGGNQGGGGIPAVLGTNINSYDYGWSGGPNASYFDLPNIAIWVIVHAQPGGYNGWAQISYNNENAVLGAVAFATDIGDIAIGDTGNGWYTPVVLQNVAVPEPSTYGLALGGLALAVVALRRRAKRV